MTRLNSVDMARMPSMCTLCQSTKKIEPIEAESPTQNKCFEVRRYFEDYQPFKKDKRTIRLFCQNFSHIKTAVINFKGRGRVVIRATPEVPNIDLGPLFNQKSDED